MVEIGWRPPEMSWRCSKNVWKFCPEEGCPKWYGCARDNGWKLGDPSPGECTGKIAPATEIRKGEMNSVK